jgi:hypothetical protein
LRGKIHSSPGGTKAYLHFELKDAPKARRQSKSDLSDLDISNADLGNSRDRVRSQILDFKVQIRSGPPCDEWEGVAGAG